MLVECHPHADPDAWLLENPGFVSGGNLRWWRDEFGAEELAAERAGGGDAYDLLCEAAAGVPPGADGVVFLPCMQGAMAPEWNGAARGVFSGLSLSHGREHLTRALLEGSAFALRDILEAMRGAGLDVRRLTIVGGGAKGPLWRQIKADVTGLPVRVPESSRRRRPGRPSSPRWAPGCTPPSPTRWGPSSVPAGGARPRPSQPRGLRRGLPALPGRLLRTSPGVRKLKCGGGR